MPEIDVVATEAAIRIVNDARYKVAGGSMSLWSKMDRIGKRLDAQLIAALGDNPRPEQDED